MKKNRIRSFAAIALMAAFVFSTAPANAQRSNDREVRDALRSLNSKIDDLEYDLRYQMQSSSAPAGDVSAVSNDIRTLRAATRDFEENLYRRRENRDDVSRIIDAARPVGAFLVANPQNRRIEDDWNGVKRQIDRLASNYGLTANWNNPDDDAQPVADTRWPVPKGGQMQMVGLSGTYELDRARSENIDDIVSGENIGTDRRQDLKDKLEAPQQIAVDIRGSQVTLATTNASPVTFVADGRDKTEQNAAGQTIRVRATLSGDNLVVSSLGGDTDYTITFTSLDNGRAMKVQRRITTDYLRQTVIAESVYNKTDAVARLGIDTAAPADANGGYSDNDPTGAPGVRPAGTGNFVVPNGVVLTASLENEIYTKVSQNNDRFRLTVQSPVEFRGAVIEGYISGVGRSGKVSGRSNITFNFERITLRNGQTYDFAGNIQSIKDQNGKTVKIDDEGTAKGDSQTRQTAKRSGAGAGIGAVIGAIAGGVKGAAIGAIIGGGAGAGSVFAQGKDDIRLLPGSTMTVQSSSPSQNYQR